MTANRKQRILVVDDNESGRYVMSHTLRRAGYEVREAATGGEALSAIADDPPDLLVLDVMLPDADGLEIAARLKSDPRTAAIPIVQISASAVDDRARATALDRGADAYVTSSVEPEVLVATVGALLRLRNAEQALAETGREWQITFDAIGDGIALLDARGAVRRSNAALSAMLGRAPEEIEGRAFDELIVPSDDSPAVVEVLAAQRRSAGERIAEDSIFRVTIDPLEGASEMRGGVAIVTDITASKHLEQRLWQAQKAESIGMLAGGVAHDFNNLLMGILGNAALALDAIPPNLDARRALEDVMRASERAADLTRQLLAYAGKGRLVIEQIDLSRLVHEMTPLIQASIPRKVRIVLGLQYGLPGIEADKGQIEQVLMNLMINAAEAIQDGVGTVTISTGLRSVEPGEAAQFQAEHELGGDYVTLTVEDTGGGMDAETVARIFEPFYSTKFLGRGLGLSATQGIVRGHKGAIRVTSAPGQGTTFEVLFPVSGAQRSVGQTPKIPPATGRGVILVVDDEEAIRRLMKLALEHHGYEVLEAENGSDALTLFEREADRISLVVLDLVMPVVSGQELLPKLLARRPDIPVIVSSGQDPTEAARALGGMRVAAYLQKPYRADALTGRVHELLSVAEAGLRSASVTSLGPRR